MVSKSPVATSSDNPSNLPSRYEIRQLTKEHTDWAAAIWVHTNFFHSPVWPVLYPEHKAQRMFTSLDSVTYVTEHGISSGMSFGVFDTEYKYKRPSSEASGGALYWDELKDSPDATSADLLERMDFPLASVALAYDGFNPIDGEKLSGLFSALPLMGTAFYFIEGQDPRGDSAKPKAAGQVLLRNATNTRPDYEGEHLMGKLARFLMREAKLKGYQGIQITSFHDAVNHTWTHPPAPFKSEVIVELDMGTYEQDGQKLFAPCKQVCLKVYVTL